MSHLPLLPILIPLFAGGLVLFTEERRYGIAAQRIVTWIALIALLIVEITLLRQVADGTIHVYLLGDWPARLGIALMVDRLSVWMLIVTTLLAMPCLLYAGSGWDRRARHFHVLFQLQLMGLNGAFLTGDIFNLFVFFEILLAASFGLMVSGGRGERIRVGFHYVAFNVVASSLFLIALGMLYSLLGSLNMAELAARIAVAPAEQWTLIQAAGALLFVVFCAKAALLPLYFWLPDTYANAPASIAALFVIMTKVGLYAVLRVGSLLFGSLAGLLEDFALPWFVTLGAITVVLASLGAIASARLRVMATYLVLASAGTLFIAFGYGRIATVSAGVYYLAHSTFAAAALFLISDMIRPRDQTINPLQKSRFSQLLPGILFFAAAIALAGLPPLSGFIGKLLLLIAIPINSTSFWLWLVILGSGLLAMVALTRIGVRRFWKIQSSDPKKSITTRSRPIEILATIILLSYGVVMVIAAEPLLRYTEATARQLKTPAAYLHQIRDVYPERRSP